MAQLVLRMVFERDDLLRVRLATGADPMWELLFSLYRYQLSVTPRPFGAWRQAARRRVAATEQDGKFLAMLCELVPWRGDAPDFLTPARPVTDIDSGCELLASTATDRFHNDLTKAFAGRRAPSWLGSAAVGGRTGLRDITKLVRRGHDLIVAPHWTDVSDVVTADRMARLCVLANDGVGALLATLPGVLRWDGRVLEVRYPEERTVYLGGRGLRLVPSYFCWGNPVTWVDSELPPVLAYQAHRADGEAYSVPTDALEALLGRTRAQCLIALRSPHTTSELAAHVGISLGMASKHATKLRGASLITSEQRGGATLHKLTPLGDGLLHGAIPARWPGLA